MNSQIKSDKINNLLNDLLKNNPIRQNNIREWMSFLNDIEKRISNIKEELMDRIDETTEKTASLKSGSEMKSYELYGRISK